MLWRCLKFTHPKDNAGHGHGDKHVVEVGEDVLLDGDDGGEEVSEEDEDEAAHEKGEDDQGTRYNLTNKHYLQKGELHFEIDKKVWS